MFSGNYAEAVASPFLGAVQIITQRTETGADMFNRGYELARRAGLPEHSAISNAFFNNNEDFFNGIRVAIKEGHLKSDDLIIIFFQEGVTKELTVQANGKASVWPRGFFDSMTNALYRLV